MKIKTEQRQAFEIEKLEGIVEGYPIVFNRQTEIGGYFREEIMPHALDEADLSDIPLLVNHDMTSIPLARHRRGKRSTMDIEVDEKGLFIKAELDLKNNDRARELSSALNRGDINGMSFWFAMEIAEDGEEWIDLNVKNILPLRRIHKIKKVYEVSAVTLPAYKDTSIGVRTSASLENEKMALENARAAALENEKATQLRLLKEKIKIKEIYG
jgi:HK97 family phage prohead protease